jgi:fatty acid desaturase
LYGSEVAAGLAMLLPKPLIERLLRWKLAGDDPAAAAVRERALGALLGPSLAALRVDAAAILAFHGSSFWLYGAQAWLLLLALSGRALLVSVTDNSFHYGSAVDGPAYAKNLRLGTVGPAFLLHFNLHHVHHRFPNLPWRALPRASGGPIVFAETYWRAIGRQFRGPIPVTRLRGRAG